AQLTATSLLHGTIRDTNGAVLPAITVELFGYVDDGNGGQVWRSLATTFTNDQGRYAFPGLENGVFRLYVYDPQTPQRYLAEYYDNAGTFEGATDIVMTEATLERVIDFELANKGEIHGRVMAESGQPLATILVKAYIPDPQNPEFWLAVASALTDQEGNYQIVGLEPNTYRVGFEEYEQPFRYVPEFYNNVLALAEAQAIVVAAGQRVTAIDAALATASQIRGRVTAADGSALSGQHVEVYEPFTNPQGVEAWVLKAVGTTDNDGYYVAPVAPGRYRVGVTTAMGYVPEFYDSADRVEVATDMLVAFGQIVDNINIVLDVAGSIQGAVTDEAHLPLQAMRIEALQLVTPTTGIPVWQASRIGFTNSDGTYTIDGLLPGRYRVRFSDGSTPRHYASEYYNDAADFADAQWLEMGRSTIVTGIDAQLGLPNTISGVVTDEAGAPLADAEVQVWRQAPQATGEILYIPEEWARTTADGSYQVTGIDQGNYKVSFKSGELPPRYRQEFYDNVRTLAGGRMLTFTTGMVVAAINAQLS
ncbi:MAG: carboxypeptidase regulatory-like domain-containing protein, partial [Caldilineaceae bacterium]|nr:carboxypeptidase regulatory-like domain-containing protein [Caldilineaceae bacterium]